MSLKNIFGRTFRKIQPKAPNPSPIPTSLPVERSGGFTPRSETKFVPAFIDGDEVEFSKMDCELDGPCYYCGVRTDSLAANPNKWALHFCHSTEPGKAKPHHVGCVTKRLEERDLLKDFVTKELIQTQLKSTKLFDILQKVSLDYTD
jgi:hypothetical protein